MSPTEHRDSDETSKKVWPYLGFKLLTLRIYTEVFENILGENNEYMYLQNNEQISMRRVQFWFMLMYTAPVFSGYIAQFTEFCLIFDNPITVHFIYVCQMLFGDNFCITWFFLIGQKMRNFPIDPYYKNHPLLQLYNGGLWGKFSSFIGSSCIFLLGYI